MRRGFCCSPFAPFVSFFLSLTHKTLSIIPILVYSRTYWSSLPYSFLFVPALNYARTHTHTNTHRQSKTLPPPLYLPNKQNLTAKLVPGMHPCTNIHTRARARTCTQAHNESLAVTVRSASIVYGFTDPLLAFFVRTTHSS